MVGSKVIRRGISRLRRRDEAPLETLLQRAIVRYRTLNRRRLTRRKLFLVFWYWFRTWCSPSILEAIRSRFVPVIDPILLQQAVEGDAAALRVLLEHFGGEVRNRIRGMIDKRWRSHLDEDDIMQVTYLEAFLHIDQLTARDSASFLAWLTRIAENALRDAVRGLS